MMGTLFYTCAGIVFLFLAKLKHTLRGYRNPKPFSSADLPRCAAYDIAVVDKWLERLAVYTGTEGGVLNHSILELGPGSDLGTGVYLLCKGASSYLAIDVNDLASHAAEGVYTKLFEMIGDRAVADTHLVRCELEKTQHGEGQRLRFVHSPGFDLATAANAELITLVFSQAAFEHFDDLNSVLRGLDAITAAGCVLIAEIDLRTHSRWIRDKDPLNIYRYSKWLYRLLAFPGCPNRLRPRDYRDTFIKWGWTNVHTIPLTALDERRFKRVRHSLAKPFQRHYDEMNQLSVILCATKPTDTKARNGA